MARPSRAGPATGSSRRRDRRTHPPRPPNAWILYRSSKFELIRQTNERVSQANVSKRISGMWKNETEDVKRHFERMADDKKAEHQRLYPGYRFSPQKKEVKVRAKGRKQSRRANKSDSPDATPTDTGADAGVDASANATTAVSPPPPSLPQPYFVPGYQQNTVLPHLYTIQYLPEACYGSDGPSPPISAAPSPASYEGSESSETPSHPEDNAALSSSSPPSQPSPSAESQVSSSSSQLPLDTSYLPTPAGFDHLSLDPYAVQPLPALFQSGELSQVLPQVQFPSTEKTFVPAVPIFSDQLSSFDSQNLEEVINFDIPVNETQQFTPFPQGPHGCPPLEESLQGMLSGTDESGVWNLSVVEDSELVAQPQGDLEIAMGSGGLRVDHDNSERYSDFDFAQFQQHMTPLTPSTSSPDAVTSSVQEDLQALFHVPSNAGVQAHPTALQRQPSAFTQYMMNFFDFEAAGGFHEDTSAVSPPLVPTTVAPQQVCLQSSQHATAMPIFTQMTNTPAVAPCASYVPPTGAIYSSMRRAGGSWKPPFAAFPSQVEEPAPSWTL